jgi:hypothetical protein
VPDIITTLTPPAAFVTTLTAGQGPSGPPGQDAGSAGSITIAAASAISGHRAVVLNAAGAAVYADCRNLAHVHSVIGITGNAAAPGGDLTVTTARNMTEPSWSWTPDAPIYLGEDGMLTQTLPLTALFSLVLAQATTATTILVSIQPAIRIA